MRKFSKNLLPLLVGSATYISHPVLAQEVGSDEGAFGLDEIIVTAQKRETSLQDTPISISVLTSGDLSAKGVSELSDFGTGVVPSMRIVPIAGRSSSMNVTMRGINPGDPTQISRDPTVGIYVDGVYLGRAQGLGGDLLDLERLEVLRGPQGTLFGRNAVGGAISMISKRPTGVFGVNLTAGVSNFDGKSIKGNVNLPSLAGFNVKIDASWSKRDGWVENLLASASDWYATERRGVRAAVTWNPAENLELLYSYDNSRDSSVSGYLQIGELLEGATPLPPIFDLEPNRVRIGRAGVPLEPGIGKVSGHSLQMDWGIGDSMTLRSISAYRKMSQGQYDNGGMLLTPYAPNGLFSRLSYADVQQDQFSQELQFIGSHEHFDWVFGGMYFEEDATDLAHSSFTAQFNADGSDYAILPVALSGVKFPDRASRVSAKSRAVFGQLTYTPSFFDERMHLIGGMRWTHDTRHGEVFKLRGVDVNVPFQFSSKRIDPAFTLSFDWSPAIHTYLKWGRAYRAGGANSRSATFRPFGEENVSTWEMGAKAELLDRRVRLNLAAYTSNYSDRQVDFVNPANPSNYETINAAGTTKISGFEADLTARIASGLTLSGSYAYTDWSAVLDINPFSGASQSGAVTYTPKHSAYFALDHQIETSRGMQIQTHLDLVASGSFYTSSILAPKTKSYAMINGRITLGNIAIGNADTKMEISLWGKNLTNAQWELFQIRNAGPGLSNVSQILYNEPRTFGLEWRLVL